MTIHQLKENQTTTLPNGVEVTRVPGGWIYYFIFRKTSTFVPYTDEFDREGDADRYRRMQQLLAQSVMPPPPPDRAHCSSW